MESTVPASKTGLATETMPALLTTMSSRPHCWCAAATSPASAIRRTAGRALAVAVLALAGLLVFVLLPGRNVPAVTSDPYLLPAVPAAHSWHPHGPNRPVPVERAARGRRSVRAGGRCLRIGHAGAARCSAIELPPSTTRYWPVT